MRRENGEAVMQKIDVHTHILPKDLPNWKERFGYGGFIQLEHHAPCRARMLRDDGKFFREIDLACVDFHSGAGADCCAGAIADRACFGDFHSAERLRQWIGTSLSRDGRRENHESHQLQPRERVHAD